MALEWRESFSVGVKEIDNQHKELFIRVNHLLDACSKGKGKDEVTNVLDFLGSYVITHFKDEEALQLKHEYPDYGMHKELHSQFIQEVTELRTKLQTEGSTLALVLEINRKVIDWLVNHIGKYDKELGKFIQAQK